MMRLLLLLISINTLTCGERSGNQSQSKFATSAEQELAVATQNRFYARYRFAHEGYEDVEVAVQLVLRNGHPAILRVKDLSPSAASSAVEEATLSSRGCGLAFQGSSSGVVGGVYEGELSQSGGTIDDCCGTMTFVPAVNGTLTFVGTRVAVLDAEAWQQLTGVAGPDDNGDDSNDSSDTDNGDDTDDNSDTDDSDNTDDSGDTGDSSEQKFYALDSSTILLSRTSLLPPRAGPRYRYLMQAVTGIDDYGRHQPPVVHIKQVSKDGAIAAECLSLRFDEKDTSASSSEGRFNFNYDIDAERVEYVWGLSDLYSSDPYSDDTFLSVGMQFRTSQNSWTSYSVLRAGAGTDYSVPLVTEKHLASKSSEWGIAAADIVAAFGADSGCDPQGHNRDCAGCILQ